ncbi:FecCD family ABC transporter permease [Aquicella lusitana]|uniref:Iron complex transport system permease protein n=1 Tax=Aquicella lusitana TaxID=254246 RepID=A0A370GY50_9COXI|nr:iron ABC transporter permease [Aquicella lusitana]RDI48587.1 iron complex transport system permease protein [Aquicella lusitana]VVC74036.1 Hemin transport system permease protein HmuU [Aquicella lusitana]
MTSRFRLAFLVFCLIFFSFFLSLSKGSTSISLYQLLFDSRGDFNTILWKLRLPRTLTAFVSGGLLALAGALMQLLLQNPLADPYVLGISGGAALFTLLMMLFGFSEYGLMGGAWAGSLLTIVIILLLARKHRWQTHTLLLSGIAMACGFSACISFILLMSPNASLHSMLFWLSGDLNDARFPWFSLIILIIGFVICLMLAPGLNILGRGEKEAQALGLATRKYRITLYLLSSLFTAQAVMLAGCIGFVGLIIPHLTRLLVGYDHRIMLPVSLFLGGSILTIADTFARSLFAPQQLPVGMMMAIIGVPIFIWLLQK